VIKKVEEVCIHQVCKKLISKSIQGSHLRQRQVPASVCWTVHISGTE